MASPVVELASRLIEVESVSDPVGGRLVGRGEALRVLELLRGYGFAGGLVEGSPAPVLLWVRGSGRPVSLFLAHFDVVPPGPGWSRDPFTPVVEDGRLYGRGAADDKGNVAALTLALSGFEPLRGTLVAAFTGDEEIGGSGGAGWLASWLRGEGLWPDYVVNGDGAFSRVIVRRRNVFIVRVRVRSVEWEAEGSPVAERFTLEVRGRPTRHAAYFIAGVDRHPVVEASLALRERGLLARRLTGQWVKSNVLPGEAVLEAVDPSSGVDGRSRVDLGLTWLIQAVIPLTRLQVQGVGFSEYGVTATPNVYRLHGGWHELVLDVRAMTTRKTEVVRAVEEALTEVLPGEAEWQVEASGGGGYLNSKRSDWLVTAALRINKEIGLPGDPMEAGGASDSRYFSPHGSQAIDYGPKGGNVHGPDEYVEISHLEKAVEFYKRIAAEIHA